MNVPDISTSNNSLQPDSETTNIVSHPEPQNTQPQQVERQDEYIHQEQIKEGNVHLAGRKDIGHNKNDLKDQPDKFIQSGTAVANAVYNVKDINRNNRDNSEPQNDAQKKVLDVVLPMGRKRLRIFIKE
ncbi:hypothetical protein ACFL6H_08235 [Candidatus Latescibacterota bacterium]